MVLGLVTALGSGSSRGFEVRSLIVVGLLTALG